MSISIRQIRAARALLNWTQTDLAQKTGLSLTAINNLEREEVIPRGQTIDFIRRAFVKAGIEFTDGHGVKIQEDPFEFRKLSGHYFIDKISDDAISELSYQSELLSVGRDEIEIFSEVSNMDMAYQTHVKQNKIKERILVPRGTKEFLSHPKAYRTLESNVLGSMYWVVYSDRFVLMNLKKKEALWIRNQSIADTYRAQFNFLWKLSAPVDTTTIQNALKDRKEKGLPL